MTRGQGSGRDAYGREPVRSAFENVRERPNWAVCWGVRAALTGRVDRLAGTYGGGLRRVVMLGRKIIMCIDER